MKRSTVKVLIASTALILFSAMIATFDISIAAIVCFLGGLTILVRHLDRCHFCGSWRVSVQEDWHPDSDLPGWNEATGCRMCKKCGIQEIDHYLLRDMNPFHPF